MDNNMDLNNEKNDHNAGENESESMIGEIGETATAESAIPDESAPQDEPPVPPVPPAPPTYAWNYVPPTPPYAAPAPASAPENQSRRGLLVFAIVMSVCFALTLSVLIASFAAGGFSAWLDNAQEETPSDDADDATPDDTPKGDVPDGDTPENDTPDSGSQGSTPGYDRPDDFEDETPDVSDEPTTPEGPGVVYGDGELTIGDGSGEPLTLQEISAAGNQVVVAISVTKRLATGAGSGIILTEDGYIATNAHVVESAETIKVLLYDGREYAASVIGYSELDDLAVIKIDETGLPVATFGDSSAVQVGDRTVVIGHPAGLEFGWTSTFGYVSAINRDVRIYSSSGLLTEKMTLLQTDANVNKGNSGGPMFNDRGEVIGIINMKLTGDYEGMGFAIPSNGAVPLLEALMRTGTTDGVQSEVSTRRPQVGITGGAVLGGYWYVISGSYGIVLTEEQAAKTEGSFYVPASGIYVTSVATTADAYNKIEEGDIIVAIDDTSVTSIDEMREYLLTFRAGDTVEVVFYRGGEKMSVSVQLMPSNE